MTTTSTTPATGTGRRKSNRIGLIATVVLVALAIVLPFIPPFTGQDWQRWLVGAALMAAAAVAFDFTAGYIDIVNFGFAAFMGLGGYTSAIIVTNYGISPWIGFPLGALAAGLLGLLTGMLTLRLRGIYAAVMTWFVALALMGIARNLTDITRGSLGLAVPPLLPTIDNMPYYYIILVMLSGVLAFTWFISRSKLGYLLNAGGEEPEAAMALGINVARTKLIAMAMSSFLTALAGTFYAQFTLYIHPKSIISLDLSFEIAFIALIGGRGSIAGPVLGALLLRPVSDFSRIYFGDTLPGMHLIIFGVVLILVMLFQPRGLQEPLTRMYNRLQARLFASKAGEA